MICLEAQEISLLLSDRLIFAPFSFTLHQGEIMSIDGEVGSGKSILAKLASGMQQPASGQIRYQSRPFYYSLDRQFFRQRKTIAYLLEGSTPLANLSAYDNASLHFVVQGDYGAEEMRRRTDDLLRYVGLEEKKNLRPALLSQEEKVILNLVMSLKENIQLLVMDEIFSSLNDHTKDIVKKLILDTVITESVTILACQDDLQTLGLSCHKRLVISGTDVRMKRCQED